MIAEEQKSIDKALRWTALAGKDLPRVVDLGVYRWLPIEGLTSETLQKILSINDRIAVARIANLDAQSRELILSFPADQMREFARRLNDRQLAAFADYERNLDAKRRQAPSARRRRRPLGHARSDGRRDSRGHFQQPRPARGA